MQAQIPAMNQSLAMMKANQTLLKREEEKLSKKEGELSSKIRAALKAGRRDIALNYATTLEQVRDDMRSTRAQLSAADQAYEKAHKVKAQFMQEIERKTREVMRVINTKKQAEWKAKVADAMDQFQVTGIDATHDEMVRRLEEESAVQDAKLEMAVDKIDDVTYEIEQEAKQLEANEVLQQFELEMGLVQEAPPAPISEKTIGPREKEKTAS